MASFTYTLLLVMELKGRGDETCFCGCDKVEGVGPNESWDVGMEQMLQCLPSACEAEFDPPALPKSGVVAAKLLIPASGR